MNDNNNNSSSLINQILDETDSFTKDFSNSWNDGFFGPRGFWEHGPFGCRHRSASPLPEGIERIDHAHPVPWGKKYERCLDRGGVSVWDRKGVWNCLISANPERLKALKLDTNESIENKEWFKDYSVYLDWTRAIKKAEMNRRERERQQLADEYREPVIQESIFQSNRFNEQTDGPKLVSESEALKQGKNVISSNVVIELGFKDGEYQRSKVTKKWYDDGTMSITESNNNDKGGEEGKKGWFWK